MNFYHHWRQTPFISSVSRAETNVKMNKLKKKLNEGTSGSVIKSCSE